MYCSGVQQLSGYWAFGGGVCELDVNTVAARLVGRQFSAVQSTQNKCTNNLCVLKPVCYSPLPIWSQVERIDTAGGKATSITSSSRDQQPQQQQLPVDAVVLAAGVGTPELCAQLGYTLPLLHKPAAILLTAPLQPGLLKHMVVTDSVFILQVGATRVHGGSFGGH